MLWETGRWLQARAPKAGGAKGPFLHVARRALDLIPELPPENLQSRRPETVSREGDGVPGPGSAASRSGTRSSDPHCSEQIQKAVSDFGSPGPRKAEKAEPTGRRGYAFTVGGA